MRFSLAERDGVPRVKLFLATGLPCDGTKILSDCRTIWKRDFPMLLISWSSTLDGTCD